MVLPLGCWGIGGGGVCDLSIFRDDPPWGTSGSGTDCRCIRDDAEIEFLEVKGWLWLDIGGSGWLGGEDCGARWDAWLGLSWPLICVCTTGCVASLEEGRPLWLGSAPCVRYTGAGRCDTRVNSANFIVGGPGIWGSEDSLVGTKLGGRVIWLPVPYKFTKFSTSFSLSWLSSAVRTFSQDLRREISI